MGLRAVAGGIEVRCGGVGEGRAGMGDAAGQWRRGGVAVRVLSLPPPFTHWPESQCCVRVSE